MSMDEPLDLSVLDEVDLGNFAGSPAEKQAAAVKKREAIEMLVHYGVFEDVTSAEAEETGLRLIRARWEQQMRGSEEKWRYVAQEFKWQEVRDDCFVAASRGRGRAE